MTQPTVMFVFTSASQFVALNSNGGGGMCTPSFVVLKADGDITLPAQTPQQPTFTYQNQIYPLYPADTTSITVLANRRPKFKFTVCDASGSATAYFLAGLALKNLASTLTGGPGGTTFPEMKVDVNNGTGATTLQLQDNNSSATTYDFWVLVQNAAGDVGLIDPRIVNQS